MTYEELHAEMVAAMKAKDKVRLGVARLVLGELKNAASRGGAHEVTEEEVTAQIKRTLKQTNETLEMSEKAGNNAERTENLREQVAVLESLLPQRVAHGVVRRAARRVSCRPLSLRHKISCTVYKCVYTVLIEYTQYARSGRTMTSGATLALRGRPRYRRERDSDSWKSLFRIRATSPFTSRLSDLREIEERLLQAIEAGRALDLGDEELIEMMRTLLESDD